MVCSFVSIAMAFFPIFKTDSKPVKTDPGQALKTVAVSSTTTNPLANKKINKIDDYYEPYWENGDWVFYRGGSTKKPGGHILNTGTQHTECNQLCTKAYETYGSVCGMRLVKDKKRKGRNFYELQLFENMCYLELANCVSKTKRIYWHPVKKGECVLNVTRYPTVPTDIVSRKIMWDKMVNE